MTAVPSGLRRVPGAGTALGGQQLFPEAVYDPVSRIFEGGPAGGYEGRWR